MRLYKFWLTLILIVVFFVDINAQRIGIGTDFPTATLDIRTNSPIASIHAQRLLDVGVAIGAVKVEDSSNYVGVEFYEYNDNALANVYLVNEGLGFGLFTTNTDASNSIPAGYFTHSGIGEPIEAINLNPASSAATASLRQRGLGDGLSVLMDDLYNGGASVEDGIQIAHFGNGYGIFSDVRNASQAMLNYIEFGFGIENVHFEDGGISFITDMRGLDGDGYYFTNSTSSPIAGGDGFAYQGYVRTISPSIVPTLTGAVLVGVQYGPGWGMLINHLGNSGRNAEFNMNNSSNSDEAIFSIHQGGGGNILVQNQSTVPLSGPVEVIKSDYLGNDIDDHIAIAGFSYPSDDYGIGVDGTGGYYGVRGTYNGFGTFGSAVHAEGDLSATGVKSFMIDHPLDPKNKILKHFALESDEVLNVYQGNVTMGRDGKAIVVLPDYFQAININYSYQLTSIGSPKQPWIFKEIDNGSFTIAGAPGSKVSWMVIANRNDAYVRTHPKRMEAEIDKRAVDKGKFLDPISHGEPIQLKIGYREVVKATPANSPERDVLSTNGSREKANDKKVVQGAERQENLDRLPQRVQPETTPFEPLKIKMEIKTYDELGVE